ncbi:MAG: glycoside hydrolase family 2 [Clostridiales bacterium]|nr:glycoside hydrolase family 2 [Clostridiales bacterium]
MVQLKTRWADKVNAKNVHQEYPRPNLVRDSYFNLNGEWEYAISTEKKVRKYDGTILVPFSPETCLSGVQRRVLPGEFLHYKRVFTLPQGFVRERVLLHFGAVDQECIVRVNGKKAGIHRGGYLAFHFDVTDFLREGENVLTLCVRDRTEQSAHARGKQKLEKKGMLSYLFYTPQSGIWKTVWMESVPEDYIENVKITPLYDQAAVELHITTNTVFAITDAKRKAIVHIYDRDNVREDAATESTTERNQSNVVAEAAVETRKNVQIELGDFKPWTPEAPHLYDVEITYGNDKILSYFGIRKYHIDRDEEGILRFYLNNRPYFFNGVLDQGYWPESLMTTPTDEALRYDIEKLKELGFNTIRKHVKVESDRFYYHCDQLGMIVWQDMPNGGEAYNMLFVTYLTNVFEGVRRHVKDNHYKLFRRDDARGRAQYYKDLQGMIERLYSHPCIAAWVPFNEGWGQFDARKATKRIREWDKTRFVNEACGWFDQGGGDMYSIHNYSKKMNMEVKPQKDRVVALTEFGGYARAVPGHCACEKKVGYRLFSPEEELTENYRQLWERKVYPNLSRGLSATIYTQTSDIEEEVNGIFTYDREKIKLREEELKAINAKLYHMWEELLHLSQEE